MASQKIIDLLRALQLGTEKGRVHWEDLPDEETFRTQVGGGLVRVAMTDEPGIKGYTLTLSGVGGTIAAEVNFHRGDPGYELIEEVYAAARLAARGGERIIDMIIRQLNPASP
jgi:hypothetical protein